MLPVPETNINPYSSRSASQCQVQHSRPMHLSPHLWHPRQTVSCQQRAVSRSTTFFCVDERAHSGNILLRAVCERRHRPEHMSDRRLHSLNSRYSRNLRDMRGAIHTTQPFDIRGVKVSNPHDESPSIPHNFSKNCFKTELRRVYSGAEIILNSSASQ